ncbi:uncharacterized protein RCC_06225 [Ramularia collo-cygni]|uniref:SET domain-containing protein n=1 Tax=Ramularia collo-cygni TaxID=112498 RepID=A0A2D3V9R3_9PEZI|nr:uncharacterized protein RCC_06225 [Ramularia collo-cygni]CZT20366.1 uncharacterized protein RCC_06225 [Ramularia collo-cygni]
MPNTAITPTAGLKLQLQGYVKKDLTAGDELTVSYDENDNYMTWTERAADMKTTGNQGIEVCRCSHCKLQPENRLVSDMRRKLMRHLIYACFDRVGGDDSILPPVSAKFRAQSLYARKSPFDFLLFAQLAEAEGVATGRMPRMSYTQAALAMLCWTREKKMGE